MTIEDGGPALPVQESTAWPGQDGMSLRDYFAAKALSGGLVDFAVYDHNLIATAAYEIADAMLRARNLVGKEKP